MIPFILNKVVSEKETGKIIIVMRYKLGTLFTLRNTFPFGQILDFTESGMYRLFTKSATLVIKLLTVFINQASPQILSPDEGNQSRNIEPFGPYTPRWLIIQFGFIFPYSCRIHKCSNRTHSLSCSLFIMTHHLIDDVVIL